MDAEGYGKVQAFNLMELLVFQHQLLVIRTLRKGTARYGQCFILRRTMDAEGYAKGQAFYFIDKKGAVRFRCFILMIRRVRYGSDILFHGEK